MAHDGLRTRDLSGSVRASLQRSPAAYWRCCMLGFGVGALGEKSW